MVLLGADAARAEPITCAGELPVQGLSTAIGRSGTPSQPDVLVSGACTVSKIDDYYYGQINIISGGSLTFVEPPAQDAGTPNSTNLWASSIIIENGGSMVAGASAPYGTNGNVLNIVLYGSETSANATCKQTNCGVPDSIWTGGTTTPVNLPGDVTDLFYRYHDMGQHGTGAGGGFFGNKVLALAYGGTLQLAGHKGTTGAAAAEADPTKSGTSWTRLAADLQVGDTSLTLARSVTGDWEIGDRIVVTTTDYLANHTEEFTITSVNGTVIGLHKAAIYHHNGTAFSLANRLADAPQGFKTANQGSPLMTSAETRAAVGLLSRSIRIVSGGDTAGELFDWESAVQRVAAPAGTRTATDKDPTYAYGGHTMYRQGFAKLQLQGVEFRWLGQGGRIGHYPTHFHMARKVPSGTYIKDSAVNESMTRWYVIHRTQGVTLQRNVGYKSIGHGYYLEDATETDNRLYANLGVFARAAVATKDNPRRIPGILAAPWNNAYANGGNQGLRYASDVVYPTAFWITNGWNDFVGNMAAGAGMCGACYWLLPAKPNSLPPSMSWSGYAEMDTRIAGGSPLKQFYGNYCSTAMHSFMSVGDGSPCHGVAPAVDNPETPEAQTGGQAAAYYPNLSGLRTATICPAAGSGDGYDCASVQPCDHQNPKTCAVTYVDTYTSSFNWAETNLGAIWMRGGWNMIDRLFMSDIQNGGVGLISSGDYSRASAPLGYWSLISHSVMVGATQPHNSFAHESGPKNANLKNVCRFTGPACVATDDALAFQLSNWSTNRMLNVYDGPFYQDSNAFLDIKTSPCRSLDTCMNYTVPGPRRVLGSDPGEQIGFLPNAAIGWKQPNGFYYPPAFHSRNLFFDEVDIRHYLTLPLFLPGTYDGDTDLVKQELINQVSGGIFTGFTDVDRQTVLNDIDGTLTGFSQTISVNDDPYFTAPVQTAECLSNKAVVPANACTPAANRNQPAARTSPYEHLTTAIVPETTGTANWGQTCTNQFCSGVRIYRQYLTGNDTTREQKHWSRNDCSTAANIDTSACDWPFIRMAGTATWQRSVLTANQGAYYIETTRSRTAQQNETPQQIGANNYNVFEAGKTYYVYFLFAQPDTKQTYHIYVGKEFDVDADLTFVQMSIDAVPFKPASRSSTPLPHGWTANLIKAPGSTDPDVLEITVDFSKLPSSIVLDPARAPPAGEADTWGSCQPSTFCAWNGGSCGCALDSSSPFVGYSPSFLATCETTCRDWSVKSLDCPVGGCVGFSFKLPGTFRAADQNRRPAPKPFPTTGPWSSIAFQAASQSDAGACYYKGNEVPTLGSATCPPRDLDATNP